MKDFKALVTDTLPIKNPPGTWIKAKNILMAKGFNSISNEPSHRKVVTLDFATIHEVVTNTHIVYFGINSTGKSVIARQKLGEDTVTKILVTSHLNFKLHNTLEVIYMYNHFGELVIAFCDGVFSDSTAPKIINLDNLGITLDANLELTIPKQIDRFKMFPDIIQGKINVSYLEGGSIDGGVAYITYCYVYEDGSTTMYFSSSTLAYLAKKFDPIDKKGLRLKIDNLDTNFSKIKLGLVIKKDGNLTGYESYEISYEDAISKTIDITSLSNFTTTSAEAIVLEKTVFDKVESMTIQDNRVVVGGYTVKTPLNLQKFFLNLKLTPYKYLSSDNEPSLMPDEVYAIYGQLQYLDGTFSDAYHIAGREPEGNEASTLDSGYISTNNLQWATESGTTFKNFHFDNRGRVNASGTISKFGYWENEEKYPNKSDFDSRTDYNGKSLTGGRDLRNKPIRYHRMPSVAALLEFDGNDNLADSSNLDNNDFYKLGLKVTNFKDAFPLEIRNKIQGYRISFVKRSFGNSYVVGNWIMTRRGELDWRQDGVDLTWKYHDFNINEVSDEPEYGESNINFSKGRVLGAELFKFRPSLDLTYIKTNYLINLKTKDDIYTGNDHPLIAKVTDNIKYVPGNNIAADTQYFEEGIDLDVTNSTYLYFGSLYSSDSKYRFYVANIHAFSFKLNMYPGFKSNSLVILGRTNNLLTSESFKGGDVFVQNEMDIRVHTPKMHQTTNRDTVLKYGTEIKIKGLYSPVNSAQLFNDKSKDTNQKTIGDNSEPDRIDTIYHNSLDYDFDVKHNEDLSTINDINAILTYDVASTKFIDKFPFRVHRGVKVQNESISTNSLRTFLSDEYYEIANNKGPIIAVRGMDKKLFVQYRNTLYAAVLKDEIRTNNLTAYLGNSDIFERQPDEVFASEEGVIAGVSKTSCVILKGMYITINPVDGQIFVIKDGVNEITISGNRNLFKKHLNIEETKFYKLNDKGEKVTFYNSHIGAGYCIGYDEQYRRLFITKKYYQPTEQLLNGIYAKVFTFDGQFYRDSISGNLLALESTSLFKNKSRTFSFSLDNNSWVCEHDFTPGNYFHTANKLFSLKSNATLFQTEIFEHNLKGAVGKYHDKDAESYIDLVFNGSSDITKILQSITIISDAIKDNINYKDKTIDKIMIYNNHQCSSIIDVTDTVRNTNNEFRFDEFRDLVKNPHLPVINEDGSVNESNIDYNKLWFERSIFISKFIVVRLIMANKDNIDLYIHEVKVNSIISRR